MHYRPDQEMSADGQARRAFLDHARRAALLAPAVAVLTNASTVMAQTYGKGNNGKGNGLDPQPPGNPKPNDL